MADWRSDAAGLRALRQRAERLVVPLLWKHQLQWLDELFTELEAVSFAHTPSLIHGDLAPHHLLHDHESGQLTGILDFVVCPVQGQGLKNDTRVGHPRSRHIRL